MSKDYNQVKSELFESLEKVFAPVFEEIFGFFNADENCECKNECCEKCECKAEDKAACTCTEECDKSCCRDLNQEHKEPVCECKQDSVCECKCEAQKSSIAEQLYTKHYNTWNILNKDNTTPVPDKDRADTITPVVDKIIILFKNILNGTAQPDPAHAGFDNLYYELSAEHHFDYYITFGGSFDGKDTPYVKVGIDLLDLHDDDFIFFGRDCINVDNYLENFANELSDRLGFASYDVVMDNNQIVLKMFYWDV